MRGVCLGCLLSAAIAVLLVSMPALAEQPARPNVLLIVTDNMGYADLGCYGAQDIRTPHIDRLAAQGVRFTQFYSNAPDCSPARTALLTGRYQHRVGGLECAIGIGGVGRYDDAIRLGERRELGLPASETTIVRLLQQAGYRTAGFGKWHLGYEKKFLPPAHGFDYYLGLFSGCTDYFYHQDPSGAPGLFENGRAVAREGYTTDLFTEGAVRFIRDGSRDRPFFLYLPYNAPSAPFQDPHHKPAQPLEIAPWDSPPWQNGTRTTLKAMIERLDLGVGRVLEALDEAKLADRTLVIFVNDNGGYGAPASNAPWTGFAHQLFEGSIRVPCIVRWPGVLPQGQATDRLAILFDLTRSIASATGVVPRAERPFDGIDILGDLRDHRAPQPRTLCWRARRAERTWRAVRDGDLKYVSLQEGPKIEEYLFNVRLDPAEKNNLLSARPGDAARLKQLLASWEVTVRPGR